MRIPVVLLLIAASALAGILLGFQISNRARWVVPSFQEEDGKGQRNVEYEDAYTNAVLFMHELRRQPQPDSIFAQEPFYRKYIRVLREDSIGVEAISLPRPGAIGNYYLIGGDSIILLELGNRKLR